MPFVQQNNAIYADDAICAYITMPFVHTMPIVHTMPFMHVAQCQLCIWRTIGIAAHLALCMALCDVILCQVEKITSLILGLSSRLAKTENSLANLKRATWDEDEEVTPQWNAYCAHEKLKQTVSLKNYVVGLADQEEGKTGQSVGGGKGVEGVDRQEIDDGVAHPPGQAGGGAAQRLPHLPQNQGPAPGWAKAACGTLRGSYSPAGSPAEGFQGHSVITNLGRPFSKGLPTLNGLSCMW